MDDFQARVLGLLELLVAERLPAPAPGQVPPPPVAPLPEPPATGPTAVPGATGQPGVRTPEWAIATSSYPAVVARFRDAPATSSVGLLNEAFRPVAPGTLTVAGATATTGTVWQISVDDGHTWWDTPPGPVAAGQWTERTVSVVPGDQVQISVSVPGSITLRAIYRPT